MAFIPKINISEPYKTAVYVVIGLVIIFAIVWFLGWNKKNNKNDPFIMYNDFENFSTEEWEDFTQDKGIKIVLVYANWCPYCEDYLADKATGSDKNVFDTAAEKAKGVVFEKLDAAASKENQAIANSYGVQGFPTIIAVKFDATKNTYVKSATFEGNRNNVNEIVAFAKEQSS